MKKVFKKVLIAMFAISVIGGLSSCNKEDNEEQIYKKIVGSWAHNEEYYLYDVLTLNSDKTGSWYLDYWDIPEHLIRTHEITYKYEDATNEFSYTHEDGTTSYKLVSVDDSKLILQYGETATDTIVYTKLN